MANEIDRKILEESLRQVSSALDQLIGECLKSDGKGEVLVAPPRSAIMRARAMLPPYCKHALKARG